MALLLTETDVRTILTMPLAIEVVEESFRQLAERRGDSPSPCQRVYTFPGKVSCTIWRLATIRAATWEQKIYTTSREGARFLVPLMRAQSGEWLALIEADYIGQMRTGAGDSVSPLGAGWRARTPVRQRLLAQVCRRERKLDGNRARLKTRSGILASRPRPGNAREAIAQKEMTERLGIPVSAASSAEEAVRGADVVVTSTKASVQPVPCRDGRWLRPECISTRLAQTMRT